MRIRQRYPVAFAALLAIASSRALAGQGADVATPPHRRHAAITYDPASKAVWLYGGQHLASESETPVLDDLWRWNGARWTQVSAATGVGMIVHKLFADGSGGLFATGIPRSPGAFAMGNSGGVTMRWDGKNWVTLTGDTTPMREGAAGAWDAHRRRFLLFGGLERDHYADDTWEFDGQHWERVATGGPAQLLGAAMAFDARRGVMVLFGGLDTAGHKYNATWEWTGTRWSLRSSDGPTARFGAGMTYDAARGEVVLFGGVNASNQKLDDTWLWNGRRWRRADVATTPPARSEGYLAYDAARHVIVMFGGEGDKPVPSLGDTWEWNGTRWARIQ